MGSEWVPFDGTTQGHIEHLWASNSSYWIPSTDRNFDGPMYIDFAYMCLIHDGIAYTIARRTF
jgi:hypothetical protein